MTKTIKLPCYGIVVELFHVNNEQEHYWHGTITSDLYGTSSFPSPNDTELRAAMDAIEALILGHACAEIDISTPAYIEGIESAVEAILNVHG